MQNNVYETAVLINAALDDEQIEGIINRIKEFLTTNGAEIRDFENWGRKRLAYMVKKSKVGYYAIFRFNALPTIVSKLERFYVLDEHILRFLTVTLDSDALEHIEKNKSKAQAQAEQEKASEAKTEKASEAKQEVTNN